MKLNFWVCFFLFSVFVNLIPSPNETYLSMLIGVYLLAILGYREFKRINNFPNITVHYKDFTTAFAIFLMTAISVYYLNYNSKDYKTIDIPVNLQSKSYLNRS